MDRNRNIAQKCCRKCDEQIRLVCYWHRLMLAASMGKMTPVQELRRLGASYEVEDTSGSTALHWACLSKNAQLVDWMLQDGADVSATNHLGRTPLMLLGVKTLYFPSCSELAITALIMAAPCVADADIIFSSCGFFFFFSSSPNLNGCRVDVHHTSTHGVGLVQI